MPKKILAFASLVVVQLLAAVAYRSSQRGGVYEYSPASTLTVSELCKLFISYTLLLRTVSGQSREKQDLDLEENDLQSTHQTQNGAQFTADSVHSVESRSGFLSLLWDFRLFRRVVSYSKRTISTSFVVQSLMLSAVYFVNNHIQFTLFLKVDPASINLFKSSTIFLTALLLRVMINRIIGTLQWCCIVLQVLGMVVAQYDSCKSGGRFDTLDYVALFLLIFLSALSSMWNENLIKNYKIPLPLQNMLLYMFGFIFNFFGFLLDQQTFHKRYTFFQGYNTSTIVVIILNSIVGVVVTAVYKYADAITKTIAYAFTTCVLMMISSVFYETMINITIVSGCVIVYISTYIYFVYGHVELQNLHQEHDPKERSLSIWQISVISISALIIASRVQFDQMSSALSHS